MSVARTVTVAAVVAILGACTAQAWWCTGHMTVAEIARENLQSSAKSTVEGLISQFSQMGPFSRVTDLTETGCWADDVKENNAAMMKWHFLNIVYNPTNFPATLPYQDENVETVINQQYDAIRGRYGKQPDTWEITFALANLIHFYGDIHQPLHVADMVSAQFPTGDLGGNLFMVTLGGVSQDLHGIWDSLCGRYTTSPNRPLSSSGRQYIENLAQSLMANYTFSNSQMSEWNSTKMAHESYEAAVTYAYANLQPGDTLDQTYLDNCYTTTGQRVTLAGYRLASELNQLFGSGSDSSSGSGTTMPRHQDIRERVIQHRVRVAKHAQASRRAYAGPSK
jgi:hypothetical protein